MKQLRRNLLLCFIILLPFHIYSHAESNKVHTPHFVCIKTGEANLRAGPSKQYAIRWVIKSKGEPVIVISEFEDWVKIRDIDGEEGWLTKSSISNSNFGAIVVGNKLTLVYARPQKSSKRMVRLEEKVRVRVKKCDTKGWCNISVRDVKGWVLRASLWGLNSQTK